MHLIRPGRIEQAPFEDHGLLDRPIDVVAEHRETDREVLLGNLVDGERGDGELPDGFHLGQRRNRFPVKAWIVRQCHRSDGQRHILQTIDRRRSPPGSRDRRDDRSGGKGDQEREDEDRLPPTTQVDPEPGEDCVHADAGT